LGGVALDMGKGRALKATLHSGQEFAETQFPLKATTKPVLSRAGQMRLRMETGEVADDLDRCALVIPMTIRGGRSPFTEAHRHQTWL